MDDTDRADSYFEIQLDRETVALAAVGFAVLLVLAFLLGRWTAGDGDGERPATTAADAAAEGDEVAALDGLDARPEAIPEDVDGAPMFGERSVSARGAPVVSPVPEPAASGQANGAGAAEERDAAPSATVAEKPPPRPEPRQRTSQTTRGGWVIQVAALKSRADAEALVRKLSGKGYAVARVQEGGFEKVQVGPFERESEARLVERRLKREEKLGTWLKRQ